MNIKRKVPQIHYNQAVNETESWSMLENNYNGSNKHEINWTKQIKATTYANQTYTWKYKRILTKCKAPFPNYLETIPSLLNP